MKINESKILKKVADLVDEFEHTEHKYELDIFHHKKLKIWVYINSLFDYENCHFLYHSATLEVKNKKLFLINCKKEGRFLINTFLKRIEKRRAREIQEMDKETKENDDYIFKHLNKILRYKTGIKIKSSTLSMLSKIVKDAIDKKDIVLYAQSENFAERNLGAKYVLEIGDTFYMLAGNGSVILSVPKASNNMDYEKDDIVELVEEIEGTKAFP